VAGVLFVVKPFGPGNAQQTSGLVRFTYLNLGFAISVPQGWRDAPIGAAQGVSFGNPAVPGRGIRVLLDNAPLAAAQNAVVNEIRRPPAEKDPIAINDGLTVGGSAAFRYTYGLGGTYFEQWWVQRNGGTYRIDIWAPATAQAEVGPLGDRVVHTFKLV
jgi:hypothetical protein